MFTKTITATVGGILVAILLSACSWGGNTQDDTPIKSTAAKCIKLTAEPINKRSVQLTVKASWAKKSKNAKNPIRGYVFQLVRIKKSEEPHHFQVPTNKTKATYTFDDIKPGRYSARVALHTSMGVQTVNKKCKHKIIVR